MDPRSPWFKKFIPIPAHAEVVQRWFNRFEELGGDFYGLCREVFRQPTPHFISVSEPSIRIKPGFWKVEGGWRITEHETLWQLLRNPVYIGSWRMQGEVIRAQNHPAIIKKAQFDRVQSLLDNVERKHFLRKIRPGDALLHGLLRAVEGWRVAATAYPGSFVRESPYPSYLIYQRTRTEQSTKKMRCTQIRCTLLDSIVVRRMLELISATQELGAVAEEKSSFLLAEQQKLRERRARIDTDLATLKVILKQSQEKNTRGGLRDIISETLDAISSLTTERDEVDLQLEKFEHAREKIYSLTHLIEETRAKWETLPVDDRLALIRSTLWGVTCEPVTDRVFLFTLQWSIWDDERFLFVRGRNRAGQWTAEEKDLLHRLNEFTPEERVKLFPDVAYDTLMSKAHQLGVRGIRHTRIKSVYSCYSFNDVEAFKKYGVLEQVEYDLRTRIPRPRSMGGGRREPRLDYKVYWLRS
ncbi:recombinase [Thermosporothrix hazakensis]|uniref:Recombinase n=2 Tax=Thermosporothrix hazakensis TaxID=644383 RepID=A0A326TS91_THEHA|nr:recombinase [Thermosporothrix hazakensis]